MHKVLVFDLDGTLAPIGKGLPRCDFEKLQQLEEKGYRIVLCSGKAVDYLCGFARQLELKNPVIIGENGAMIQIGAIYPPERIVYMECSETAKEQIRILKKKLIEGMGDGVFFQPNQVVLNPFPRNEQACESMMRVMDESAAYTTELIIHRHPDCLDILPKEINKRVALEKLAEMLHLEAKDFIAVGDGPNDRVMFGFADVSIGVSEAVREIVDYSFEGISDALDFLLKEYSD